ncbi:hypothetical protein QOZ80_6BG0478630 [Eleusine coracana subsp. coracana]|nr:hypothetical protein QOZ80_6BG0478630 [Eleusine coracana subsp. coracana]
MQDDTVHAAAVVLAAAARSSTGLLPHHHGQGDDHACAATKTRWWSRLKAKFLCFRRAPHANPRRIADYASPEPAQSTTSSTSYHTHHATRPSVAFVAPPSSPASSLLTSGSPSPAAQVLHFNLMSSTFSSPTASIFAVGPYAREPQQLVSPPAFSAGLTEPSTAPLTPPPESACGGLQPGPSSSPEVPFARFLSPSFQQGYYQLQPGSPIVGGALLSPVSTSSSPPLAWIHRRGEEEEEEGLPPSGEFVFDRAAGEWTTFADAEDSGRRSCGSISIADDAAEDGGSHHWPFRSSFRS